MTISLVKLGLFFSRFGSQKTLVYTASRNSASFLKISHLFDLFLVFWQSKPSFYYQ